MDSRFSSLKEFNIISISSRAAKPKRFNTKNNINAKVSEIIFYFLQKWLPQQFKNTDMTG